MTKKKKIINLISAICLLIWGICSIIFSWESDFIGTFLLCFAWCRMLWTLLTPANKMIKDELTKKAWYSARALSSQIFVLAICLTILANTFFHFLDTISSSDILLYSLYLILILMWWSYAYYIHHPEKTWL